MTAAKVRDPLLTVLAALNQSNALADVAPTVLNVTAHLLGADIAEMWLADNGQKSLSLQYEWSAPGVDVEAFARAGRDRPYAGDVGLIGHAWSSGKAATASLPAADAVDRAAEAERLRLRTAFVLPIESGRRSLGVLVYFGRRPDAANGKLPPAMVEIRRHLAHYLKRSIEDAARRHAAEQLSELAATDPLTGLHNRREFDRILRTVPRRPYAVMSIDVDHLKEVNDDHGHGAGDDLLRSVAATLALLLRGTDVLARVGGDEFAVFLPELEAPVAARVAERLRAGMHSLQIPFGPPMVSVGWASAMAGMDPVTVWKAADECLYAAKRSGGDAVVGTQFSGGEVTASSGPSYTNLLSEVLLDRPLHAVYQPIISVLDGRTIAYEALARPDGFTPTDSVEGLFTAARRAGRLVRLDAICRAVALAGARDLPPDKALFLNVSGGALLSPATDALDLLRLLEKAGRSPQATVLEISERERIRDLERLMAVLAIYRREGVRIAIDDVGDGHATFELLAASGAEYLKLGRTLTMAASRSGARAAIVAALTFARGTNAVVIAEGIENEFACDQIRALGIEYGQGFGLGKPTLAAELEDTVVSMATRTALRPLRPGADRPVD